MALIKAILKDLFYVIGILSIASLFGPIGFIVAVAALGLRWENRQSGNRSIQINIVKDDGTR